MVKTQQRSDRILWTSTIKDQILDLPETKVLNFQEVEENSRLF